MDGHLKVFHHWPTAHIFGPGIHHVKIVVALQPQFPIFYDSLLTLLHRPDSSVSLLHDSSLTCLVYCCFFCFLHFSFLDRSSPIPAMPTKFHHHLQAWIHSMPVTPGSRPLLLCFGGTTHHRFHPKYPLKFCQNHHWMTCRAPQLPQPPPSFFNLLLMAWTSWMQSLRSQFTLVLFWEGENMDQFQHNFEAHQPPVPLSPYQDQGTFITQTTQNSPYIVPNPTTKELATCTPPQPTHFTEQNSSPNHHPPHLLQRRPTDDISSQDKSPKAPTVSLKCSPSTQLHALFKSFLHKAKATSPCNPTFSSQGCTHGTFQSER